MNKINEIKISSKKGKVSFTVADENTPYIKDMIQKIADYKNEDYGVVLNRILFEKAKLDEDLKGVDRINAGMRGNTIESIIFDEINSMQEDSFDLNLFNTMFKYIITKNRTFLKVEDRITGKRINFKVIVTPGPSFLKQPEWVKKIKTAAATPDGTVIFNKNFANQLITFASMKGVKPKGGMYVGNGGIIPDSWAYIEFLILHEIYHIIHADHFYQSKKKGMTGLMQNYLGDFITNYNLVKAGYEQPPIGLFNSKYNFDNYTSMDDMQNDMIEDFKKLSKDQKKQMNDQMDDHIDKDNKITNDDEAVDDDSQSGQSNQSDDSQSNQSDDSQSNQSDDSQSDNSQSDNSQSDDSQSNQSDNSQSNQSENKSLEDVFKETDSIENADDGLTKEQLDQAVEDSKISDDQARQNAEDEKQKILDTMRRNTEDKKFSLEADKTFKPVNWKKLIKLMIPKEEEVVDDSYSKISRRTRSQLTTNNNMISVTAGQTKSTEASQSLLFILDYSGSMSKLMEHIAADLYRLIDKNKSLSIKNMFIIKFDSNYSVYKINIDFKGSKHTYQEFVNRKDIITNGDQAKLKPQVKPVKELLGAAWGAGTVFPDDIFKIVKTLSTQNFNQVMFTDSDILNEQNIETVKKLMLIGRKKPYSFNLIVNDLLTYNKIISKMGGKYKYMSYIDEK